MRKKILTKIPAMLLVAALLVSCESLQQQMKRYYPQIQYKDFRIESIDFSQATVIFDFTLKNNAPVEINFDKIAATLKVDGKALLQAETVKGLQVVKDGTSEFSVRQQFKYLEVSQSIADLLKKERVTLRLEGQVHVDGKIFGKIQVPFESEKALDLPKLPQVRFGSIQKKGFDMNIFNPKANFEVELFIKNNSPFNIQVDSLQYGIAIENINAVSGKSAKQQLAANKDSSLKIPVSIGGKDIISIISKLKDATSFQYKISGSLTIDLFGQKINLSYSFP